MARPGRNDIPPPLPTDPEQLRDAVLAAEAWLRIDAARQYGFITGGPHISVERCEECVALAREHGIVYTEADIQAAVTWILVSSKEAADGTSG